MLNQSCVDNFILGGGVGNLPPLASFFLITPKCFKIYVLNEFFPTFLKKKGVLKKAYIRV